MPHAAASSRAVVATKEARIFRVVEVIKGHGALNKAFNQEGRTESGQPALLVVVGLHRGLPHNILLAYDVVRVPTTRVAQRGGREGGTGREGKEGGVRN